MSFRDADPIIPMMRQGTQESPFKAITEAHVVTSGKVVLSELPDEFAKVKVTSPNRNWYEIKEGLPSEEQYVIDYRNKLVTFHIANNGLQLQFEYMGTGVLYYPTSMIYTKFSDGEITQTLDELTDDMYTDKQAITKAIEDARTAISGISDKTNYAEQQGSYAKAQGDTAKAEATNLNTLKTNVTTATTNANNAINNINTKITEANTAVTNANTALNNFNHQGTYSAATKYFPRNVVDYNGSSYMNIAESIGILPTDTSKWKPVASKGEQGLKGEIGSIADAWQGAYSAVKAYAKGHLASYNGRVYIAKSASTGNLPTNTTFWEIFSDKGSDGAGSVNSVNGKTGAVTLDAQEVGAIPASQKGVAGGVAGINAEGKVVDASGAIVEGAVKSVNDQTGAVTIPVATTSVDGLFSSAEKTKLNGIATGANNYTHPSTHPASIITQDASNRFVTDAEKTTWNLSESNAKNYADSIVANASSNFNRSLYKEVANLQLQSEASKRVTNGATFGFTSDTSFGMTIDTFRAKSVSALAVGATIITLDTVTGLTVGMEVTIFDDVNLERKTITAINTTTKVITVSALTKAFKAQVNVARTMLVYDLIKQALVFGSWSWTETLNHIDKTVLTTAHSTSPRTRLLRLSNGWLVASFFGANYHTMYKSMDNGNTWSLLMSVDSNFMGAVTSVGTMITLLFSPSSSTIKAWTFDATTLAPNTYANGQVSVLVDSNQSNISATTGLSITSNAKDTLHATWVSTNPTSPNSKNIRYVKGTINVDGSVSWGAVIQVTAFNASTANVNNPTIVVDSQDIPHIFAELSESSIYRLFYTTKKFTTKSSNSGDSAWGNTYVYTGASYAPSAIFVPQSINGLENGRIWLAWHGTDSVDASFYNIRVAYSDDGGLTWSAIQKLTTGNLLNQTNTSITANKNNEVFIVFQGQTSIGNASDTRVKQIKNTNGTWGAVTQKKAQQSELPSTLFDPTLAFSEPILIYKDVTGEKIGFYGTWNNSNVSPLLENDIRFMTADAKEFVAWVEHDEGLTVDATLNGQTMTKTPTSTTEDRFLGTLATKGATDVNLRLKRAPTSDDNKVYKILGGIG